MIGLSVENIHARLNPSAIEGGYYADSARKVPREEFLKDGSDRPSDWPGVASQLLGSDSSDEDLPIPVLHFSSLTTALLEGDHAGDADPSLGIDNGRLDSYNGLDGFPMLHSPKAYEQIREVRRSPFAMDSHPRTSRYARPNRVVRLQPNSAAKERVSRPQLKDSEEESMRDEQRSESPGGSSKEVFPNSLSSNGIEWQSTNPTSLYTVSGKLSLSQVQNAYSVDGCEAGVNNAGTGLASPRSAAANYGTPDSETAIAPASTRAAGSTLLRPARRFRRTPVDTSGTGASTIGFMADAMRPEKNNQQQIEGDDGDAEIDHPGSALPTESSQGIVPSAASARAQESPQSQRARTFVGETAPPNGIVDVGPFLGPPRMSILETATTIAGAATTLRGQKKRIQVTVNKKSYKRLNCIGRGGSARVYRVMADNCRTWALKKVFLRNVDQATIQGFKREIEVLQKLVKVSRVISIIDWELDIRREELNLVRTRSKHDSALLRKFLTQHS